MIVYSGSVEDPREVIQFFRREVDKMRALRKLVVNREKTVIWDVNRETMEFPGLTYGNATLDELLRELGVVFNPQTLHNPNATPSGVKEFELTARWTWGRDRVMYAVKEGRIRADLRGELYENQDAIVGDCGDGYRYNLAKQAGLPQGCIQDA